MATDINRRPRLLCSRAGLLAALALCSVASPGMAYQPFVTDDTGTQGEGGMQLEFSWAGERTRFAGESATMQEIPLVATRGVTDALDIFVCSRYMKGDSGSGPGGLSFGAKWRFFEDAGSGLSFVIKPEAWLPVNNEREAAGLGSGRTSAGLTFAATRELPWGAVHANLALTTERHRPEVAPDVRSQRVSLAPVWNLTDTWKLGVDLGLDHIRESSQRRRVAFAELGAVYSPDKDLDFAIGLLGSRDDLNPRTRSVLATVGVTWRFR
jgi:hypothetical protein